MAILSKGKTFTNGELVTPQKLHELVDLGTVSGIVNADIANNAAIADSKLAQITTANKVAQSAVTNLTTDLAGKAPTSHTHTIANVTNLQTALDGKQASGSYAPATGIAPSAITGTAVITTDSRLSDARTPTAHTHGNITNAGAIGTTANLPVVTTTSGVLTTVPAGTAGQVLTSNGGTSAPSFQTLAATSTNANNLTGGSAGTVPYQSAAGTTVMLAAGTSGQVLRSNGAAAPSWLTIGNSATLNTGTTSGTVATGNHTHDERYYTETEVNNLLDGKLGTTATAAAATKLATARTINGVAFDGSSNITIPGPSSPASLTADADTLVLRDNVGSIAFNNAVCREISGIPSFEGSGEFYLLQTPSGPILDLGMPAVISGSRFQTFNRAGVEIGKITTTGTTGVAYNTTSDYRLKTNIEPLTAAVARLLQIPARRFNWLADPNGAKVDGFLAHEAQAIVPESVTGYKDEVDAEGKPIHQGIDQSKLVPLLVAAVQELAARVAALEAR